MAAKSTSGRIILPDLTAAQLAAQNPVLKNRQLQYEGDTGKAKRGDGVTRWNSLPYVVGTDGKAATVKVGTVTTLSPGQPATVNNSGTENAAVLNFGIPKGQAGSGSAGGLRFVELSLTSMTNGMLDMYVNLESDPSNRFYGSIGDIFELLESGLYLVTGQILFYANENISIEQAYIQMFDSGIAQLAIIPIVKGISFLGKDYYVASVCKVIDWEDVDGFSFSLWPSDGTLMVGDAGGGGGNVSVLKLK